MQQINRPCFNNQTIHADSSLLVIGGCGGIGYGVVDQALALGAKVVVMDLTVAGEQRNIDALTHFIGIDLRDKDSIIAAFAAVDSLRIKFDSVVISSGYTLGSDPISQLDIDKFDDVMAGNLRGPVIAMKYASQYLSAQASIVLLSTAIGQIGSAGYAAYGAAKSGLNAITRILATELSPAHRVNAVAPGAVDTPFIRGGYATGAKETGSALRFNVEEYNKKIPLGRMANIDDVIGPILFLLSDSARYITGQVIHVNGGGLMRD
jgi:3-oxoacyl-[acyl-carrier protein] reductase